MISYSILLNYVDCSKSPHLGESQNINTEIEASRLSSNQFTSQGLANNSQFKQSRREFSSPHDGSQISKHSKQAF